MHFGSLCSSRSFAKIVLCIFFASYFAEKQGAALHPDRPARQPALPRPAARCAPSSWPGASPWSDGPRGRHRLLALFFTLFIGLLWVATGRVGYLVLGWSCSGLGPASPPTTSIRSTSGWRSGSNPWPNRPPAGASWRGAVHPGRRGESPAPGSASARGRLLAELEHRHRLRGHRDEMGLLGCDHGGDGLPPAGRAGLRVAQSARSEFARLTATGLTSILGFQAFFIMAGWCGSCR